MILGVGIDLVDVQRVRDSLDRWGLRWAGKIFTPDEIEACQSGGDAAQRFAARYAAKEAVFKAAGMPSGEKFFPKTIEIRMKENGAPELKAGGNLKERLESMGEFSVHISLTHEKNMAGAVAVIEGARQLGSE